MVVNAVPRLQERIVGRRIAWPLDVACSGAGGDHPIVTCPIGADGKSRLHTIYMERASDGAADWESLWATLTFEVQ